MNEQIFRKLLVAGGIFNVMMSGALAVPFLSDIGFAVFSEIHRLTASTGIAPARPTEMLSYILIHGFGIVDVSLGLLLFYAARDIKHRIGIVWVDAIARIYYGVILTYYVLGAGFSSGTLGFALVEFVFGGVFVWGCLTYSAQKQTKGAGGIKALA